MSNRGTANDTTTPKTLGDTVVPAAAWDVEAQTGAAPATLTRCAAKPLLPERNGQDSPRGREEIVDPASALDDDLTCWGHDHTNAADRRAPLERTMGGPSASATKQGEP